jgi:hypothetical protein
VKPGEETYLAAYDCERRCLIEVDLTGIHANFTVRQARVNADAQHRKAHEEPTPVRDGARTVFSG